MAVGEAALDFGPSGTLMLENITMITGFENLIEPI